MISELKTIPGSRLICPMDKSQADIFFSLVDYRNNYFTSNDPERLIEFYDGFENRDQLIRWMKERPKGASEIHEVDGDKDIIVVIPTADFNGKYARECRDNIFRGLHIVFVESGRDNFYFNFAHSCNVGIEKAMEYDPKWIVVSNDDMYKIDSVEMLANQLLHVDDNVDVVFPVSSEGRFSCHTFIGEKTILYSLLDKIRGKDKFVKEIKGNLIPNVEIISDFYIRPRAIKSLLMPIIKSTLARPFNDADFIATISLAILSHKFIANQGDLLFDETYINENEDLDLSFRIKIKNATTQWIDWRLGDLISQTLSTGYPRFLRGVAGKIYFYEKYKSALSR